MENHERAEQDYLDGMKYKDIAEKYDTTINTVKSWKKRYGWSREEGAHKSKKGCTQKRAQVKVAPVQPEDGTSETLQNDDLSPEQQMFCIYYIRTFNATQSYQKAYKCSYETALRAGPRLLKNVGVKEEIDRLKEIKRQQAYIGEEDIVELQMRIAFADIGNYTTFGREEVPVMAMFGPVKDENGEVLTKEVNVVRLSESCNVDTQLIKEVKQGKEGVSVKLEDRQKAIDWLTKYFLMHPESKYRAEYERKKVEKEGGETTEFDSDGFLDALKGDVAATFEGDDIVET